MTADKIQETIYSYTAQLACGVSWELWVEIEERECGKFYQFYKSEDVTGKEYHIGAVMIFNNKNYDLAGYRIERTEQSYAGGGLYSDTLPYDKNDPNVSLLTPEDFSQVNALNDAECDLDALHLEKLTAPAIDALKKYLSQKEYEAAAPYDRGYADGRLAEEKEAEE